MKSFLPGPPVGVLGAGLLLGLLLLAWGGLPPPADPERRVSVGSGEVSVLSSAFEDEHGRSPTRAELRRAIENHVATELLRREAAARGYLEDELAAPGTLPQTTPEGIRAIMQAIGRARLGGDGPTEEEARAFHALRPDRYRNSSGEALGWPAARDRVMAELTREAHSAADAQFLQEIAGGYRIAFEGTARGIMAGAGSAEANLGSVPEPASPVPPVVLFDLVESEAGSYELTLRIPVDDGGVAPPVRPVLPTPCAEASEPSTTPSPSAATVQRAVTCPESALAGVAIPIEGLQAAGFLLHLEARTADGRAHTALTGPARSEVRLPAEPGWAGAAFGAAWDGLRTTVRAPELWVLLLVVGFLGFRAGALPGGIVGFGAGYLGARWFAVGAGPLLSSHLAAAFLLLTALVPALDLARGHRPVRSWLRPPWLAGALLGGALGAVWTVPRTPAWLSGTEWTLALVGGATGVALGVAVLGVVTGLLRRTLGRRLGPERAAKLAGTGGTIAAVALLVPGAAALGVTVPAGMPRVVFELGLFSLVLGLALSTLGLRTGRAAALPVATLLVVGAGIDLPGADHPLAGAITLGPLFLIGIFLALTRTMPARWVLPPAALAAMGFGWHLRQVSEAGGGGFPPALAVGAGLVALLLIHAGVLLAEAWPLETRRRVGRLSGVGAAGAALLWRLADYRSWIFEEVAPQLAIGLLPVPALALGLLTLALLMRPRRRRVPEALGLHPRPTRAHWVPAGLAFFLLPMGTITAANPAAGPDVTRGDDMERVVSDLLLSTYTAFNLPDEAELYDRLSETVTEDLVTDLYLDSRRRLRAGTLEEDEVTIRSVELVHLGEASAGSDVAYRARWIVTSRIRHLQHTHDRRNIYDGILVLRMDEGRWKIRNVELSGEDRMVVSWNPS